MFESAIAEFPVLSFAAGQRERVAVEPVLAAGHALTDWASFVLTIRSDPLWPRSGATLRALAVADPSGEGWPLVVTALMTIDPADPDDVFAVIDVPSLPGLKRYVCDVWGVGGTVGPVQLIRTCWFSVTPSVR